MRIEDLSHRYGRINKIKDRFSQVYGLDFLALIETDRVLPFCSSFPEQHFTYLKKSHLQLSEL